MDINLLNKLNTKEIVPSRKAPMETTLEVLQCLAAMEISNVILVGEPDMYRFIYNINRVRRNTLPKDFKYLSKGRKYTTIKLVELDSLLIIRVK